MSQEGAPIMSREIELTQEQVTIVDDEMYDELTQYTWCAFLKDGRYCASRSERKNGKQRTVYMHQVIAEHYWGWKQGRIIGHSDEDNLNNVVSNLYEKQRHSAARSKRG